MWCRYPHLSWVRCASHSLDLALEDIGKLGPFKRTHEMGRKIATFITNHQRSLGIFRTHSRKQIMKPGETRFYTSYITLQRLMEVKDALQQTVVSAGWSEWAPKQIYAAAAAEVKKAVLDEAGFWETASQMLDLFKPIVKLLRLCDSDVPTMGKARAGALFAGVVSSEIFMIALRLSYWEPKACLNLI